MRLELLLIAVALGGCGRDSSAPCVARDRSASDLEKWVIAAMCEPWGQAREVVLTRLVDEVLSEEVGGLDVPGEVLSIAREVGPDACVAAGYPDPGKKPLDPTIEGRREMMRNLPPPPPPSGGVPKFSVVKCAT